MKQLLIAFLLAVGLALAGCATSSNSSIINGNWSAILSSSNGAPVLSFTTTLRMSNGNSVVGSNLTFTSSTPCFSSTASETGGFTLNGTTNGITSGGFQLTIQSAASMGSSNTLSMLGTVSNNSITGTWVLSGTGAGCTGSGTFTMTKI